MYIKKYFLLMMTALSIAPFLNAQYLIVGTYTNNNSTSKGIYVYDFNKANGALTARSMVETVNPSYQVTDKNKKIVYSANETAKGAVSAFSFKRGKLALLNTQPSNGDDPCYVAIDKTGHWLFCANYSSGDFSIYPIKKDGSIGALHQFIKHTGSGPDSSRQVSPHVHSITISPNNQFIYACDLGTDKIVGYPFDAVTGKAAEQNSFSTVVAPGGGPRHMAISSDFKFAYVVEEMHGTVNACTIQDGKLSIIHAETHLNIPKGKAAGAAIHISNDGHFLYVSQRSNSTIEIYKINKSTGAIQFLEAAPTLGNFPRDFTFDPSGNFLLAANQKSNNITIFKINKQTGLLTYTGNQVTLDAPASLTWIAK